MRRTSGVNVLEVVIIVGVVAVLFAVLMPVMMPRTPAMHASHCQSNMNRIGKAFTLYLADYDGCYPVNGSRNKYAPMVRISGLSKTNKEDIYKARFKHGINWVEALWPYVRKVSEDGAAPAWVCTAVPTSRFRRPDGFVTYAFNANLVNQPEGIILNGGTMMVVRELSRFEHAVLRPTAPSPSAKTPPNDPFLDADETTPDPKYKLHGDGSHILFADGHVKAFGMSYFPKSCEWDRVDKQWYNYVTLPEGDPRNKSIAVSP